MIEPDLDISSPERPKPISGVLPAFYRLPRLLGRAARRRSGVNRGHEVRESRRNGPSGTPAAIYRDGTAR